MSDEKSQRNELYEHLSHVASAIASPARLKMLQLLAQSPLTVEELSHKVGESIANTSQHVRKLAAAGLVKVRKEGLYRRYRIASPSVLSLWESLQNLTSEIQPVFEETRNQLVDPTNVAPMSVYDALALVQKKLAVLIDARDPSESSVSLVEPAQAIPAKDIVKGKFDFPKRQTIFVFCRGRMCTLADPAVSKLREKGYKSFRLTESPYVLTEVWNKLKPV
jgi:DNA-binding transcriptional ArsR family regulator